MEEYSVDLIYPINSVFTLYEKDYYYDSKLNKACRRKPMGFYTYKGKRNNTKQLLFEVDVISMDKSFSYNATLWGPSFVGLLNRNDINLRKIPMDEELKCQINNYGTIMEIMGALNSSNFSKISLVTESGGSSLN